MALSNCSTLAEMEPRHCWEASLAEEWAFPYPQHGGQAVRGGLGDNALGDELPRARGTHALQARSENTEGGKPPFQTWEPPHYTEPFPLESEAHELDQMKQEPASFPLPDVRLPIWLHYRVFCK